MLLSSMILGIDTIYIKSKNLLGYYFNACTPSKFKRQLVHLLYIIKNISPSSGILT